MGERDVYIAIMRAASRGKGLRLTRRDCFDLSFDDAVSTRAGNSLSTDEAEIVFNGGGWSRIDPKKDREAANYIIGGNND